MDVPTHPPAPPASPTPSSPNNGENGDEGDEGDDAERTLPQKDVAEEVTGLLFNETARGTSREDQAKQHDAEVARLEQWRDQVRRWLDAALPQLRVAERHLDDLRMSAARRPLSEREKAWRGELVTWITARQHEVANAIESESDLGQEIKRHQAAAARLRAQAESDPNTGKA